MTTTYTFKTCDGVTGVPNAFVPQMQGCSMGFEMSDVGSIGFDYYAAGVNSSFLLANRVEIATFQNGVEMDDGRFIVQSDSNDELETDGVIKFVGVSLLNMLQGALVYSANGSIVLGVDQTFINATAGGILKALFDQNAARGADRVMDRITYASFGNTLDSAGNAWAFTIPEITYKVGTNYLDVIRNLVNNGMIEVKMVGRDLRVYNAGGLGADQTIIADPVILRKGRDLMEAPRTRTKEQIAAVALVVGNENALAEFIDPSVGAAWGYDEVFLSQGGISDPTTLGILSQQEIDRRSQIRIQNTHKVALANSPWTPYVHYKTGDYIFTDRGAGPERLRIRQMVLDVEDGGVASAALVLNDRFLEREIVIARRVDGILGGATSTGSVAVPVPPEPGIDITTPMAPSSLSSSSAVMVTEAGRSVAAVALSWPAVTQNTDLSVIADLDHYEVEYHIDAATSVVAPTAFSPARDESEVTKKFDRRWKTYGWIGGDGGASVRTTSGKDWWYFADSFIGTANGDGARNSGPQSFIHNSIVITDPAVPATFDTRIGMGNKLNANDAFLESTVGQWQADTNCAVARDTGAFWYGAASLRITATAGGDAIARIAAPPTSNYAVTAGKVYSVMAKVKTLSGTARNVQIGIRWYNSSNSLLGTSISTSIPGLTTGWVRYNLTDAAPVGAVKAAMIITIKAAAASQQFHCDTMGLNETDQIMASWNDPNRALNGAPVALINPEDLGGTAIAGGSLAAAMFWVDSIIEISGTVYGFLSRYSPAGVFQNSTAIAQWDGATGAFQGVFAFTSSDVFQWGNALWVSGGFLHIFGFDTTDAPSAQDTFLMRVPTSNITGGTKEYLLNVGAGTWTTTRASTVSIYTGFASHFGNIDFRSGVFNSIVTIYGAGQLRRLTASVIQGPWTDTGPIYTQPNVGGSYVAYFPRRHPQFDDNSGVLMSYSVNGPNPGGDIRTYSPKFARGPASFQNPLTPVTPWSAPRQIEGGVLTDNIGDIPPGYNFQARVRAVDSNGNESSWTTSSPIRTVDDVTPPNKPSAPILSPAFKGIRVEWDGFDYQGGPPPSDWARMEVHMSKVDNFQPGPVTLVDTFVTRLGGVSPIQDLEYGEIYYIRFVALDVRNNPSTPSDTTSTSPEQLVNTAEIAEKLITGAKIADSTIAVRSITVAAFEPSIVPNGGFEDEKTNADGTGTGLPSYWGPSFWTIGGGATVTWETSAPLAGTKSIKMSMATAADGLRYASAKFPVTPGRLLAASVKVKASRAIANPAFEIHIVCGNTEANTGAFPAAGVSIWGTSATKVGTTAIQVLELQRIVDPLMTYAQVYVTCLNSADGSGWDGWIDEVEVRPVGGSAFIADASILNAKIANLAVDDAKIASASIGKLTAGSLTADMTVSARIKTANTGARVELNSSGLQAFNTGGLQTVDIASATGNVTVVGTLKSGFSGTRLIIDSQVAANFITFYPSTGTNTAYIASAEDGSNSAYIISETGTFSYNGQTSKHRLYMSNASGLYLHTVKTSGGASIGGLLRLGATDAQFSMYNSSGVQDGAELYMDLGQAQLHVTNAGTEVSAIYMNDTGRLLFIGDLDNNFINANGVRDTFIAGSRSSGFGAGVTSLAVSYGASAPARPGVVYSIFTTATATNSHRLSIFGPGGFTVVCTTGGASNYDLCYFAYRQ